MVLNRYHPPEIRNQFSQVFGLQRNYLSTKRGVEDIRGYGENPPAGVVPDTLTQRDKERITGLVDGLDGALRIFEISFPQDIASQDDIAGIISDVRCYIDSERRR